MRKRVPVILNSVPVLLGVLALASINGEARAALNPAVEKKVEALVARMTLDEKVGQMTQADMAGLKNKADVAKYFLGSVLSGGDSDPADNQAKTWATAVAEFQAQTLNTRLKLPILYGVDAVHGHNNVLGAVIFPQNVGMGATRSPELVEQEERVTAEELAATGIRWAFAPCVAVARDARWGRTYESFGENPELAALLGPAAVRGFQGSSLNASPSSVLACVKHFLGDGGTTGGKDQGNTECDEATLRRLHLPGYVASIKAGAGSIMISYNSWNGAKMHGNKHLITEVLKGELGFDGFVVSDWAAIDQLGGNFKQDVEQAVNAGLDMGMIPNGPGQPNSYVDFIRCLKELVAENRISQARIDDAVRRILRVKARMGLLEDGRAALPDLAALGSAAHREVARDCVRHSLVLLKNSHQALPLAKSIKRLAVVGKAADDLGIQCGGWTITWQGRPGPVTTGTTLLAGIRKAVSPTTTVIFSPDGADLQEADAAVVVVGELPYAEMKGDDAALQLNPKDEALIARVKQAGQPVVTILLSGRPLVLGHALDQSDAFLAAWLPGTEGQGVADVLFGDFQPSGKLPRTWPRNAAQVANPALAAQDPLFAYGFGLKY